MKKKIIAISILILTVLFAGTIEETIIYYANEVKERDSKIATFNSQDANLNNEIADLNNQISNLKGQLTNLTSKITNLTSIHLVTALGTKDIQYNSQYDLPSPTPYNHLFITGSVANTGEGTAHNAGLQIVAYGAKGEIEINITVPLVGYAVYGADSESAAYAQKYYGNNNPSQLGSLFSSESIDITVSIFHKGNASNWSIIPVYKNPP